MRKTLVLLLLSFLIWSCKKDSKTDTEELDSLDSITYVRKYASSSAAKADIDAMNIAFEKLRKLDCDNPVSWYYQGAIHWVPDTVQNGNPYCKSYQNVSQLKEAWDNCTHKDGTEIHFLIWHRLYIWYLEKTVRKYSGKKDFALPYWDYTNPDRRVMPPAFRDSTNALYESERLALLNNGDSIQPSMNGPLDITSLFENKLYQVFNQTIDGAPHGAMHGYIGGSVNGVHMFNRIYQSTSYISNGKTNKTSGLMAHVPTAGFDPIFWLHHGNIDYLWEKWDESPNGHRPLLDSLKAYPLPYVFFEPDGKKVSFTIEEAYELAFNGMDYVYDQLEEAPKVLQEVTQTTKTSRQVEPEVAVQDTIPQQTNKTKGHNTEALWSETIGKEISGNQTFSFSISQSNTKSTSSILKSGAQQNYFYTLEVFVSFEDEPKGFWELYVNDKSTKNLDKLVGTLHFFGAALHAGHGHMKMDGNRVTKKFEFDISDEISVDDLDALKFYFKKIGGNSEEKIKVEKMSFERHKLND